ncbi:MAG: 2-C-methyl-D-erythritol 4-phosphate cytidylyltransferase [Dehalococcoidia bacterium]|nr:2-C-methyl-D-erythritol 4-phosphate cytidylyltransferase [Dehalococcoidia bacterium]
MSLSIVPRPKEKVCAVIVAAGRGERMGDMDKLFAPLAGEPVLSLTLRAFHTCPVIEEIVLVLNPHNLQRGRRLVEEQGWWKVMHICLGGERRQDSVREGLARINGCDWVVIHDGARPLVSHQLILCGLQEAQDRGAAVAAVPVRDTLKVVNPGLEVEETPNRSTLWAVQTPQVFRYQLIWDAYARSQAPASDDASLIERLGHRVKVYMGSYDNIKITTQEDLAIAEVLLQRKGPSQ